MHMLTQVGGFVGTKTEVWAAGESESSPLHLVGNIYPEDKSRRQVFPYVQSHALERVMIADVPVSVFRMNR